MIYTRVYKRYFPVQHGTDLVMLDEQERMQLAKCIRKFPLHLQAWSIETLHKSRIGKSDDLSWLGESLAVAKKESTELADKIMAGHMLTEKDIKDINVALLAHKYNFPFEMPISPRSHLERVYWFIKEQPTIGG